MAADPERDAGILVVVRTPPPYGGGEMVGAQLERLLSDLPVIVDEAPPLLVLRTSPGGAQAVASAIDLSFLPGVVGTVAGDDTIFIACRDAQAVRQLRERIESVRAGHRSISEQPTRSTS